ncbi:MAG: hypothetical protein Q7J82_00540 [Coriobacteriia bacterium]|nr:hypothetical protein [Coriobacteriia bacterium]
MLARRMLTKGILLIAIVAAASTLSGCGIWGYLNEPELAPDAPSKRDCPPLAIEAYKAAGMEGEPTAENAERNAEHDIAAEFILQQQGRNSDLTSYGSVDLVTITKPDGTEILAVILDGKEAVVAGAGN